MFKDHLWKEAKRLVEVKGKPVKGQVDNQSVLSLLATSPLLIPLARIMRFPRWRGLHHFNDGAMAITFSDGSTFEDLSKVFCEQLPR